MYKICTSNHAIARQREIENGLLEYMSHKSYEHITVINLCEKLGIPRKTFYRYFSSKEGALYALIDHALKDAFSEFQDIQGRFATKEEIMTHFFSFWLNKKPLLDALAKNDLSGILLQRAISFTLSDTASLNKIPGFEGTERAKKYITVFLVSGIISLIIQWHHNNFDKTPAQMSKIAVDLFP